MACLVTSAERGEVVELDNVFPLVAEEPVGVAFLRALGLQEGENGLSQLQHFLEREVGGREREGGGEEEGGM